VRRIGSRAKEYPELTSPAAVLLTSLLATGYSPSLLPSMSASLHFQTITELAAALDARRVSSVELTRALVERTKAVEPAVHAFNSFDEAGALKQAEESDARRAAGQGRGALDGIPIGLKDVIAVENQPLTASSRMLGNFISPYDATVTTKLKQAGAVLWGRLNCDEFAMGSSTENSAFGPTGNPWDVSRVPGGRPAGVPPRSPPARRLPRLVRIPAGRFVNPRPCAE